MRTGSQVQRRVLTGTGVVGVLAWIGVAVLVIMSVVQPQTAAAAPSGDSWSSGAVKVTRTYYPGGGPKTTLTNKVTVKVDKHTQLQSRERVHVSWSGAVPTAGLQGNPFGESGSNQEYPVVVMECRGTATTVEPDTCWTNTAPERSYQISADSAPWLDDLDNTPAQSALISGLDPKIAASDCGATDDSTAYHFTTFKAASGKVYAGCADQMPPEAAVGSVDPPNEVFGQTGLDGNGSVNFEVRTNVENESLGCSDKVACSIVVIPIMGLSCKTAASTCNWEGNYFPGDNNDNSTAAQLTDSGYLWWSASNWHNRIVVPLGFAPPPNVCQLSRSGTPEPFYGTELISQAALQWAPAYCLNKSRFDWQSNSMPDDAALALAGNGGAAAAEVGGLPSDADTKGFAFAPTALTGFGIAFDVDDPSSDTPLKSLKLNARLLAKLLSESYPGDAIGAQHPGLGSNPWTLAADPEFLKLNPDYRPKQDQLPSVSAATLYALSNSSLVMQQLTDYINSDSAARSFLDGKPDPWGMKVNPAYKGIKLPVSTWPLLDDWIPTSTGNQCLDANHGVYLQRISAPVSSLRLIATALLFNWPGTQLLCEKDIQSGHWTIGRSPVQPYGQRFILGLVTLGDAARYGLPVAALDSGNGTYVGPTEKSIDDAVSIMDSHGPVQPRTLDQAKVRRKGSAYPGTMIVYTAAKTYGLTATQARHVAQFIRVSSTEGQQPGRGNGQLAEGYVPITNSGETASLFQQAQVAEKQIAEQSGAPASSATTTPSPSDRSSAPTAPSSGSGANSPGNGPGDGTGDGSGDGTSSDGTSSSGAGDTTGDASGAPGAPSASPTPGSAGTSSASGANAQSGTSGAVSSSALDGPAVKTAALSSKVGGRLLPTLLIIGVLAGLVTVGGRLWLRIRRAR